MLKRSVELRGTTDSCDHSVLCNSELLQVNIKILITTALAVLIRVICNNKSENKIVVL